MAAQDVIRPDFSARLRPSIFSDEHQALRESIRAFVQREIVPHAEEWEQTTFPDAIVRRMGELGFLGLSVPEEYGGQGGDYYTNLVLAEEMGRSGSGGLPRVLGSRGSGPASTASSNAASSTVRASGPTWSSDQLRTRPPARLTRP